MKKQRQKPKYQLINEDIRFKISSGKFFPGSQIPIREDLMTHYGVTRTTVDRALKELINDGLLTASRRNGTFVKDYNCTEKIAVISWIDSVLQHKKNWHNSNDYFTLFGTFIREFPSDKIDFISPDSLLKNMNILRKYKKILWCNLSQNDFEQAAFAIGDRTRLFAINRYYDNCNFITTNHRQAAHDLTELFCSNLPLGPLYYLDQEGNAFSSKFIHNERLEGFIDYCAEHKRFYRIIKFKNKNFEYNINSLRDKVETLTREYPGIIISPSADTLGPVLAYMRENRIDINCELFYGDFDNENSLNTCGIPITSVLQNFEELAYTALQFLNCSKVQKYIPYSIINSPFKKTPIKTKLNKGDI